MARRAKFAADGQHFFSVHAKPRNGTADAKRGGGAYVSCWINFRLYEGALTLAKFYIKANGWRVVSVSSHRWINGASDVDPGARRYFREAQKDGASFVYHHYSKQSKRVRSNSALLTDAVRSQLRRAPRAAKRGR